jgi:putative ABC transport system permease protein
VSLLAQCGSLIRGLFRRRPLERSMDDELHFHMAAYANDLERRGVPKIEADRMARAEFAGLEGLKERCREARGLRLFDELAQDARYAARTFCKDPGFAAIAILTLALGVGANTSIFSVVNAWVLQPLPYPHADRLATMWVRDTKSGELQGMTAADFYDWSGASPVFENVAGWNDGYQVALTSAGEPDLIRGARVSNNFFSMLGVQPILGRDFNPQDDRADAPPVAILSDVLWHSRFGADRELVGKRIELDGQRVTVAGILPAEFQFMLAGRVQVWMPLALSQAARQDRKTRLLNITARLKSGVSLTQASAFMTAAARRLEQSLPDTNRNRGVLLRTLREEIGRQTFNQELLVVFGIVGCVLLIACTNVANLMAGRATRRRREFAVRLAMGAGRGRLLRQLLTENVILFIAGAGMGVLFANWGVRWISNSISFDNRGYIPNFGELHVNLPVLGYTLAIAVATGILFGFAPALQSTKVDVNHTLKESTARLASRGRLKSCLIVFETSLALMVLIAAGLLINSLARMYRVDAGFDPRYIGMARVDLSPEKFSDMQHVRAFFGDVVSKIRSVHGVKNVAVSRVVPFCEVNIVWPYAVEGRAEPATRVSQTTQITSVTPEYFSVLAIPILSGRGFTEQDREGAPPVVVINQTMARRHWAGADPVGQHLRMGPQLEKTVTIVGVVKNVKLNSFADRPEPQAYLAFSQTPMRSVHIVVRADGDPLAMAPEIRAAVWSVDKNQPVSQLRSMGARIADEHAPYILITQMTSLFGLIALFLAAIGIYGVMSYTVSARKQEIGIRIALGASARGVIAMILRQGMSLVGIGLATGLLGSFALTRLLSSLLFDLSSTDVTTFATVGCLLAMTGFAANFLPARRAALADPTTTLHHD